MLGSYFSISMNLNMFSVFLVPAFDLCFWLRIRFCFVGQIRVRVRCHRSICHVEI